MGGGGSAPLRQLGAGFHFGAGFGPAPLRQRWAGFHFGAGFGTLHCGRLALRWSRRALRALSSSTSAPASLIPRAYATASVPPSPAQPHSARLRHRLRSTQPRAASFHFTTPSHCSTPCPPSIPLCLQFTIVNITFVTVTIVTITIVQISHSKFTIVQISRVQFTIVKVSRETCAIVEVASATVPFATICHGESRGIQDEDTPARSATQAAGGTSWSQWGG